MDWSFCTSHMASLEQATEVWSKGTNAKKMGERTAAKGAQTKGSEAGLSSFRHKTPADHFWV